MADPVRRHQDRREIGRVAHVVSDQMRAHARADQSASGQHGFGRRIDPVRQLPSSRNLIPSGPVAE